jgi:hypothetical protein
MPTKYTGIFHSRGHQNEPKWAFWYAHIYTIWQPWRRFESLNFAMCFVAFNKVEPIKFEPRYQV